jgi:hypothetical protein
LGMFLLSSKQLTHGELIFHLWERRKRCVTVKPNVVE